MDFKELFNIIISTVLTVIAFIFKFDNNIINTVLFLIAYLIVGYEIIIKALKNIFKGEIFDENFLMTVATIGAICIGEIPEAVAVMLFYQIGEFFQDYAVDKSKKSIANLMDIRPDYANLIKGKQTVNVSPKEVNVNDVILVKPGEKIPLDGIVVEGNSMLNTKSLTGEAVLKSVNVDDEVLSGCINIDGILKIKVTKLFSESTVSKILDLVENASNRKSKSENFISKFAKYYTPIVVISAVLLAILPPLILDGQTFNEWIYRALSFLVVSCPCALVISIPLSFFSGIGASSKIGILIKGSNYLETLANTEIIACDKTGTLTEGVFKVQSINAIGIKDDILLKYAAYAEYYSNHPISLSLKEAYGKKIIEKKISKTKEISGKGISCLVDGKKILIGNEMLMKENNIKYEVCNEVGTICYIAIDLKYAGNIIISDKIKDTSYMACELFKKNKIKKIVMLTGDDELIAESIAKKLKIDEYHAELLPNDKVTLVEELMKEKTDYGKLLFIGDGINDAPVLALADIGVAMGALGSDAAIEAADIVIMNDDPSKVAAAIKISKRTVHIVKENIIFAIAVKIAVLLLSALGITTMWAAVFADVGVSILAVLNALRLLKIKDSSF